MSIFESTIPDAETPDTTGQVEQGTDESQESPSTEEQGEATQGAQLEQQEGQQEGQQTEQQEQPQQHITVPEIESP
jgi:hypothetical protein